MSSLLSCYMGILKTALVTSKLKRLFNSSSLAEEQSPNCSTSNVLYNLVSSSLSHFTIFYFWNTLQSSQTVSNTYLSLFCFSSFAQNDFSMWNIFSIPLTIKPDIQLKYQFFHEAFPGHFWTLPSLNSLIHALCLRFTHHLVINVV